MRHPAVAAIVTSFVEKPPSGPMARQMRSGSVGVSRLRLFGGVKPLFVRFRSESPSAELSEDVAFFASPDAASLGTALLGTALPNTVLLGTALPNTALLDIALSAASAMQQRRSMPE